jgi:hypothetical protein
MQHDISELLNNWHFDPHEINVRVIEGLDQKPKIQLRIEMGIIQMERDGRPDGERPYGAESVLDHLESAVKVGEPMILSQEVIEELYREGMQYYRRYLAFFHLEWFDFLVRDTDRNLRLLAFVREHARRKRDRWRFDQFRPYLLMMNARGRAGLALGRGDSTAARTEVFAGIERIEQFLAEYGRTEDSIECREIDMLRRLAEEIQAAEHVALTDHDSSDYLKEQLHNAIEQEDYERAAQLRDRIHALEKHVAHPSKDE